MARRVAAFNSMLDFHLTSYSSTISVNTSTLSILCQIFLPSSHPPNTRTAIRFQFYVRFSFSCCGALYLQEWASFNSMLDFHVEDALNSTLVNAIKLSILCQIFLHRMPRGLGKLALGTFQFYVRFSLSAWTTSQYVRPIFFLSILCQIFWCQKEGVRV